MVRRWVVLQLGSSVLASLNPGRAFRYCRIWLVFLLSFCSWFSRRLVMGHLNPIGDKDSLSLTLSSSSTRTEDNYCCSFSTPVELSGRQPNPLLAIPFPATLNTVPRKSSTRHSLLCNRTPSNLACRLSAPHRIHLQSSTHTRTPPNNTGRFPLFSPEPRLAAFWGSCYS
ncbi:hypothetical protein EDB81DRAFT_272923 [Dactylonectria macrodidyma]|uniref:Uncharacterized protein n=1 Tax=Dactylonectria macrodidyma TaxID=307937 RepID=A0A9P9FPB6_9HYPO|nr:hypothetical protein EDB81DRAFT_272923 [Dactylonectria macrodidyma]